jgi:hypothetical protein
VGLNNQKQQNEEREETDNNDKLESGGNGEEQGQTWRNSSVGRIRDFGWNNNIKSEFRF